MIFHTEINIKPLEQTVVYADALLFLGSCFADEVGVICKGLGFNALVNPFGVLYNPASIAQSVERLDSGRPFTRDDVIAVGERQYCTFNHNTAFWNTSEDMLLQTINQRLGEAHEHFMKSKWLVVSLGTSWVFKHRMSGQIVSNCHKLPAHQFDREFLTVERSSQYLSGIVERHPEKQFIFTVSPLRHLKDGMHGSQLSKAALLLAVNEICRQFANAHYFPAYEIMMDELRDYRFYKEDMVHPTEQAVRYIWEHFAEFAINASEKPAMNAAAELRQMLEHKPLFPETEAFKRFELQKERKTAELKKNYPDVRLS
ncbi:MAG: GSCFA domain-containing protein [Bacteroidales bacterium]|nr:GSCFA domain-containing protein [Bacteroidales bacterium]MBR6930115.1 GSCFA domain-containing protein [Bacteroidales bacterium]